MSRTTFRQLAALLAVCDTATFGAASNRDALLLATRQFVRHRLGQDPELSDQLQHSVDEHKELLDAITMRDADLAERLAGEHMRLIRKRVATFASGELHLYGATQGIVRVGI